ncbi:MAG: hypothetical protein WCF23_23445 [Candidatus Nitrosopolaris sp.]
MKELETVFITDFKFSTAFVSQIESKVVAFQKYYRESRYFRLANTTLRALSNARMPIFLHQFITRDIFLTRI